MITTKPFQGLKLKPLICCWASLQLRDDHYQTLSGIETLQRVPAVFRATSDDHYQTLSGIETLHTARPFPFALGDDHYQTLSGIETI